MNEKIGIIVNVIIKLKHLNLIGVFLVIFVLWPDKVTACDCENTDISDNLKSMTYVFVGHMVSAYEVNQNYIYYEDNNSKDLTKESDADEKLILSGKKIKVDASYIAARFEILESFKGDPNENVRFRMDLSSCGISPTVGLRYLIFADKNGITNECFGSKLFDNQFGYSQDKDVVEIRRLTHHMNP
jgi:hypothetical protein